MARVSRLADASTPDRETVTVGVAGVTPGTCVATVSSS